MAVRTQWGRALLGALAVLIVAPMLALAGARPAAAATPAVTVAQARTTVAAVAAQWHAFAKARSPQTYVAADLATVVSTLPNAARSWEAGWAFGSAADVSSSFGDLSYFVAADGLSVGVAARASSGECAMAEVRIADTTPRDFQRGDSVAGCTGATAINGSGGAAPAAGNSPPATPTELSVVAAPGKATVSWAPVVEPDMREYRLYEGTTLVGVVPYGTNTTTFNGLTSSTRTVTMTAVDNAGNESARSVPISATPGDTAPAVPTGLAATPGDRQVTLTWNANAEADLVGYRVYRDGTLVATVAKPATTYTATGLTNHTAYAFTRTSEVKRGYDNPGLAFRVVGGRNYLAANYSWYRDRYELVKMVNGVETILATAPAPKPADDLLRVTLSGTTITVALDGTDVMTATKAFNATATRHGLVPTRLNDVDAGGARFDDFEIRS